ncbi:MAG: aminodeoxychorismate lyase, partial [Flavobacteriaceae bacterium]|nr:aminodeoxychorismate lyase [Flavobacteriaceae bacterium]
MYIKKILWIIAILGLVVMGWFSYRIYDALFTPNTRFSEDKVYVHIPTGAEFNQVYEQLTPLLDDPESFATVARQKKYSVNVRPGRYAIERGMNNNTLVNVLRSRNEPVMVSFNNQETLPE